MTEQIKPVAWRYKYVAQQEASGCVATYARWMVTLDPAPKNGKEPLYSAETVQQLERDLEIEKQRVVDLGVLCLESVPRDSLEKQRRLYEMAVKGRADMREALRNERDKVQQLQRENAEQNLELDCFASACADLKDKLAAANECVRINAENSHYWHGEAIAAKQQADDYRKSYLDAMRELGRASKELGDESRKLKAAKQQLAEAERDAEIGAAVNRACKELPEGYFIVICLENGAGDIQLKCPDYRLSRNDFEHEADTFGGQINAAIDAALTAQAGEKQ